MFTIEAWMPIAAKLAALDVNGGAVRENRSKGEV